jgi:hypothetical protein
MVLEIPISERAREYGYIFWPYRMDEKVRQFFGDCDGVVVMFEDSNLGEKRIDWEFRRISLGYKQTKGLDESLRVFKLTFLRNGRLQVKCQ